MCHVAAPLAEYSGPQADGSQGGGHASGPDGGCAAWGVLWCVSDVSVSCDVSVCYVMCHVAVPQAEYSGPLPDGTEGGGRHVQAALMGDVLADDPDHPAWGTAGGRTGGGQPQFSLWK